MNKINIDEVRTDTTLIVINSDNNHPVHAVIAHVESYRGYAMSQANHNIRISRVSVSGAGGYQRVYYNAASGKTENPFVAIMVRTGKKNEILNTSKLFDRVQEQLASGEMYF